MTAATDHTQGDSAGNAAIGLPPEIRVCLFDLDGVLTQTAKVHAKAWKQAFDALLKARSEKDGSAFVPFDEVKDYEEYVDGKPREDGVRDFLASRNITLPEGEADDPVDAQTVNGVGNGKNETFNKLLKTDGLEAFDGSVRYVAAVRAAGLRCAVVSSSANTHAILKAVNLQDQFEAVVDGNDVHEQHLHGKPAPDSFLAGAKALNTEPAHAVVFEDALAGVAAGRAGHFGYVVGVDRLGQAEQLRAHGADVVVQDLDELLGKR
ncbi:MAG TPA: beta-phosphoglucomutase family hydrolase [Actinocrinis sp.]|nr:beta-phosphoglucomutase family hydrolase [Actinocrinis sp.]